jgi:hypothetical protein
MSRLLINESPIMIIPSLAAKIGLNEAVVLQQIHYWLGISKHKKRRGESGVIIHTKIGRSCCHFDQ